MTAKWSDVKARASAPDAPDMEAMAQIAAVQSAAALTRIADALDDYMDVTLAMQDIALGQRESQPEVFEVMRPLVDALVAIRARRAER